MPLGARPPIPNFRRHGKRWAPEAHAGDVVRARAYLCRRGRHNRSFRILSIRTDCPLIVDKDKSSSYYIGDAAGRPNDHASTDRKFALNVGVQFYTPEVRGVPAHGPVTTSSLATGILPQDTSSTI